MAVDHEKNVKNDPTLLAGILFSSHLEQASPNINGIDKLNIQGRRAARWGEL